MPPITPTVRPASCIHSNVPTAIRISFHVLLNRWDSIDSTCTGSLDLRQAIARTQQRAGHLSNRPDDRKDEQQGHRIHKFFMEAIL